jgi:hypothetical protein
VAQFRKDEDGIYHPDEGLESAFLGALLAGFTQTGFRVHLRHGYGLDLFRIPFGLQKIMGIGFFHIAIDKGDPVSQGFNSPGQIDGHGGFAGSAFATGNYNTHTYVS